MESKIDLNKQIIDFLSEQEHYISTIDIAKSVLGSSGKTSQVNPVLYSLLSKNKIKKKAEENGTRPRWKLRGMKKSKKCIEEKNNEEKSIDHTSDNYSADIDDRNVRDDKDKSNSNDKSNAGE